MCLLYEKEVLISLFEGLVVRYQKTKELGLFFFFFSQGGINNMIA